MTDLLEAALPRARKLWPELDEAWALVPPTTCARRTKCCALLPPMGLAEACRLFEGLESMAAEARERVVLRTLEYFFLNPVRITACPFLEGTDCLVYQDRPFGCRSYGLWSPSTYRRRQEAAVRAKKEVQQAWRSLGVTLPQAVVNHRPRYCREVKPIGPSKIDDGFLEDTGRRVQALDQRLEPQAGRFARDYRHDLGFLLSAAYLGHDTALRNKVSVVREYLDRGRSSSLDYLMSRAGENIRGPAV